MVTFPLGPLKMPVVFLVDIRAQMSALQQDVADHNSIVADKKQIQITDVFGKSQLQATA